VINRKFRFMNTPDEDFTGAGLIISRAGFLNLLVAQIFSATAVGAVRVFQSVRLVHVTLTVLSPTSGDFSSVAFAFAGNVGSFREYTATATATVPGVASASPLPTDSAGMWSNEGRGDTSTGGEREGILRISNASSADVQFVLDIQVQCIVQDGVAAFGPSLTAPSGSTGIFAQPLDSAQEGGTSGSNFLLPVGLIQGGTLAVSSQ
jgi:hypothetical protein